MQYDRQIIISRAGSRKATLWNAQTLYWSEMVDMFRTPVRGVETIRDYMRLPKAEQDNRKDVGGFTGQLKGNRRKATDIIGRDLITLDLDNIPAGGTPNVLRSLEGLGCAYAVYSTRKHEEGKPRLRVIFPLSRTATPDEYEPIARKMASFIGIALCDATCFEASRLMYWPSCCADSQYVFQFADKQFCDTDGLLATYQDWRNVQEWPEVPGTSRAHARMTAKQGNPLEKSGIVGAFCKQYNIYSAIEKFLPGVYTPTDTGDGRLTFAGGSTAGGAIIYDDGLFLYSHHATDPCSGKLVNAFDLVRLHKFGDLDDEAKPDTPANKLPSYLSMRELAYQDHKVSEQQVKDDFGDEPRFQGQSLDWLNKLEKKTNGKGFRDTPANVKLILNNDPALAGKFARDIFGHRDLLLDSVPWRKIKKPQALEDDDDAGLQNFLFENYEITRATVINNALSEFLISKEYHPVQEYLKGLRWDGVPRVETLLVDYLGADDSEINRAITRLTLAAAVARVFHPGCKFDYVLTLISKQGIGKSSLLNLLGGEWFSDSLGDIRGKDAYEHLQGSWIIEFAELTALRKADVERIKQFTTSQMDKFRLSYGKRSKEYPRQCIFVASTNDFEPLKDQTGNRRFLPVAVGIHSVDFAKRNNFPRDQIWAEAVEIFKEIDRKREPLDLPRHLKKQMEQLQRNYTEESTLAGEIREKLDEPWGGGDFGNVTVKNRVCAIEIWSEMLGFSKDKFTTAKAREINDILRNTPGWGIYPNNNGRTRHGGYGLQTVFERETPVSDEQMKKPI